jgi:hypothetical protein
MTNCEWFDSKLEAYFCDELGGEELQRFQAHLTSCSHCREQVQSLREIDPLVQGVMRHRLAVAQTAVQANGRPRVLRFALAAGTLAAAVVLVVVGLPFFQEIPAPTIAIQPPGVVDPIGTEIKKAPDTPANIYRSKPTDGTPVEPVPQPHLDEALANGPDFALVDAGGYTTNLESYRDRVLLFGVVSPEQKAAVANLEQLYEAFGSNPKVRILAVARHRDDKFGGTKFPLFFNNGSKLLGAQEGEFILVDPAGKTKLEGSLSDSRNVARIRSEFGQLGIR